MRNRLILAIVQIRLSWLDLISMLVDRASPVGQLLGGCWADSLVMDLYSGFIELRARLGACVHTEIC
jgi:hypothetical protein